MSRAEIEALAIDEGDALLEAFDEIVNPDRQITYQVRRKKKKKST